jgi:amino acid transporter
MENYTEPKSQNLMYALIYGLLSALVLYLLQKLSIETPGISTLLHFGIATLCILIPVNQYKTSNGNQLTLGNSIKIGFLVGLIGGLIYAVYVFFHYDIINPDFVAERLAIAKEEMQKQSTQMTEEQMEQALMFSEMFMHPAVFSIMAFIGALLETLIVSLVVGLIKKSN